MSSLSKNDTPIVRLLIPCDKLRLWRWCFCWMKTIECFVKMQNEPDQLYSFHFALAFWYPLLFGYMYKFKAKHRLHFEALDETPHPNTWYKNQRTGEVIINCWGTWSPAYTLYSVYRGMLGTKESDIVESDVWDKITVSEDDIIRERIRMRQTIEEDQLWNLWIACQMNPAFSPQYQALFNKLFHS